MYVFFYSRVKKVKCGLNSVFINFKIDTIDKSVGGTKGMDLF